MARNQGDCNPPCCNAFQDWGIPAFPLQQWRPKRFTRVEKGIQSRNLKKIQNQQNLRPGFRWRGSNFKLLSLYLRKSEIWGIRTSEFRLRESAKSKILWEEKAETCLKWEEKPNSIFSFMRTTELPVIELMTKITPLFSVFTAVSYF